MLRPLLKKLSGQTHQVFSAVSIAYANKIESTLSTNRVTFAPITESLIDSYILTGEPLDKAGAYGIQGLAAMWIQKIEGKLLFNHGPTFV